MAVTNQEITEIAQEAIESKSPVFVEVESFSTKLSDQSKELGDSLKVAVYEKNASSDFAQGSNNYETADGGGVDYKIVTLDKHLKSTFQISEQTTRFEMAEMMRGAAVAVATGANKYIYDEILVANYVEVGFTGAASVFDSDSVADLWDKAQIDEYRAEGRSLVLATPYYTSLLKDDALKAWQNSATDETLRKSIVRELNDFEVMSSTVLPTSAGATGENLVGFMTDKAAMAVATGIPAIQDRESAEKTTVFALMQGPNGLTMQFRKHYDAADGIVYGTVEMLVGKQVLDATRLARLISA